MVLYGVFSFPENILSRNVDLRMMNEEFNLI